MKLSFFTLLFTLPMLISAQNRNLFADQQQAETCSKIENTVISDFSSVPCYVRSVQMPVAGATVNPKLFVANVVEVDESGLSSDVLGDISTDFELNVQYSVVRKIPLAYVFVNSLRRNSVTGKIEKLVDYRLEADNVNLNKDISQQKRSYATQSVLSTGTWYKINTSQAGIYKISYSDLESWNIDPSNIDPTQIRLFGNGPRMLPELNSEPRIDDLEENAIYVEGGADGTFDASDYILFYAEGIQYWTNSSGTNFKQETNLYSDKNYYFITFDNGPGLRISDLNSSTGVPTHTVDRFYDFSGYELNQYNLIKSGKNWFGDVFESISLTRSYSFTFANIITDSLALVRAGVAGRSSTASLFTLSSGSNSGNISIAATSGYTSDYAKENNGSIQFNPTSNTIPVLLTYNQSGNSEASGWLDYIQVFVWRDLLFSGNQMSFRNPVVAGIGNLCEYKLGNASSAVRVWDVSNPLHPAEVKGTLVSNEFSFTIPNDSLKQLIAFNGVLYNTPAFNGVVSNQNLHALSQTDYLIVSHSVFRSQATAIGQLHQDLEGYSYLVVDPQSIYNEFSGGKQDPTAIRDFVKMFYDRASVPNELPKFLLLVGDASYDYKNRVTNNNNLVPTFESINSVSPTSSYASDDFFGLLDDSEGYDCNGSLDIAIGRLPVNSTEEADAMLVKLQKYTSQTKLEVSNSNCSAGGCIISNMADWRNQICFVADDGDGNLHSNQADNMARRLDTTVNFLNIDKIYLDAYNQVTTTGGERCPEVNEAISQRVEKGALIVNYTGHGGEVGWSLERILDVPTIQNWTNACNMPVFITATCEFSRFDDPARVSAGEYVILNKMGGGIALLTTTRLAYASYNEALNNSFYDAAFDRSSGRYPTLGELTAFAKTDNGSVSYLRNFMLIGDPALTMSIPQNTIVTTEINGQTVGVFDDTISALSYVTIKGYIADQTGVMLSNYNGTLYPTVYDKAFEMKTLANNPAENYVASFMLQKNVIYKGKASIINGEFSFSFMVPKDIQYTFGKGRISYYAENGTNDATGWYEEFIIGGSADTTLNDNTGPEIRLFINNDQFISGGTTNEDPVLLAFLSDENGINTVGTGIGHDLTVTLDANTSESVVLNDYYEAETDSYTNGTVRYPFKTLSEGTHTMTLKAWDILNNSSEASIDFVVTSSAILAISHVLNYPNPFTTYTEFWFEHNQPCCGLEVQIQIFTITGKLAKTINQSVNTSGFRADPIQWDGTDDYGDPLARGVYIYRVRIKNSDGQYAEKSEKLVILK
ncbi:MAG: oxidoreductase [Bacteroidetes bacterium HGW-Bacteroidetes-6]|jgi:hypothetical protein|nr:MAG: oxidoreductase [Bacteroidetes bacterium HGW-Bacteroidetes-6]